MNKYQHYEVGYKIREGVYGIGNHGGTMTQNTGNELECKQNHVDCSTGQRYLEYLFLSVHDTFNGFKAKSNTSFYIFVKRTSKTDILY